MADFRIPGRGHRLVIIGQTGSGKSQAGMHYTSLMPFDKIPYTIIDYKGDELINEIPYTEEIGYSDVPKHPGVYIIHPRIDQQDEMEKWLWRVHERGNMGLVADEGYMLPKAGPQHMGAYTAILTQGRSKSIPVITLTQRPSFVTNFAFTESEFHNVFYTGYEDDKKKISKFSRVPVERDLPQFHSWWYDVGNRATFGLTPVPDRETILNRFGDRLAPKRRFL